MGKPLYPIRPIRFTPEDDAVIDALKLTLGLTTLSAVVRYALRLAAGLDETRQIAPKPRATKKKARKTVKRDNGSTTRRAA